MVYELNVVLGHADVGKNKTAEIAFPDIVSLPNGKPWGEVKSVNYRNLQLNLGRHADFADSVRREVYASCTGSLSWEEVRKVTGGHLGSKFLRERLGTRVEFIGQAFLSDYITRAGGRLFVASDEGWTMLDGADIGMLGSLCVTGDDSVRVRLAEPARPFFTSNNPRGSIKYVGKPTKELRDEPGTDTGQVGEAGESDSQGLEAGSVGRQEA